MKPIQLEIKTYEELKEELGNEYDTAMYEINISALKEIERLNNIIKEVREKVDNFDVFKEFTFPLMKRDEEQQVKSSIDYEWKNSLKKPILEILDKGE